MEHYCDECGELVSEYCQNHPEAMVISFEPDEPDDDCLANCYQPEAAALHVCLAEDWTNDVESNGHSIANLAVEYFNRLEADADEGRLWTGAGWATAEQTAAFVAWVEAQADD